MDSGALAVTLKRNVCFVKIDKVKPVYDLHLGLKLCLFNDCSNLGWVNSYLDAFKFLTKNQVSEASDSLPLVLFRVNYQRTLAGSLVSKYTTL